MLAAVAATHAQSLQLHVATIDPESVQRRSMFVQRHGELIEVDVPHLPAAPADEVMVVVGIDFELDGGAAALERSDQAGAHQFLHVAIHGRMGDGWQNFPDFLDQVVSGGMPGALAERAQQDVALRREAQTTCDARLPQLGVAVAGRLRRHSLKCRLASTAAAILRDANTQLITITITLDFARGRCPGDQTGTG